MDVLRSNVAALGLPLRSLEVELGPSQYEFTFAPEIGMAPADAMVLFRSALKQVARRHGYLVSFMCRPRLPNALRQRLAPAPVAAGPQIRGRMPSRHAARRSRSSPLGRAFLAGLLANARAARCVRDAHAQRLQALSRRQYDGADPGDLGAGQSRRDGARDGRDRRSGDASREPRRRAAGKSLSLHGVADLRGPGRGRPQARSGPSADAPYRRSAEPLPATLAEALAVLRKNACFRAGFGDAFVDYYAHIKEAEIARFHKETMEASDGAQVSEEEVSEDVSKWEHREYFDLF